MILLIDIGNTCLKWELRDTNQEIQSSGYLVHRGQNLRQLLKQAWAGLAKPKIIHVSNVAGTIIAGILQDWCISQWYCTPQFAVTTHMCKGLINGYEHPEKLGIDRWLASIAVWDEYHTAACVVDCGSAVTVDVISNQGYHLGGQILPGVTLMQNLLISQTEGIKINRAGKLKIFATNTEDAVISGCHYAIAGAIGYSIKELKRQHSDAKAIITGGDATRIVPILEETFIYIPNLVIRGLAVLAES